MTPDVPTILLCDDDPGVLFTLSETLDARGYTIVTARSGEEAVTKLGAADVLVTDLKMPGMSGLELLAESRRADPDVPVIVVTAQGTARVAVEAMKAGAYDFLQKPFVVDEVRLSVARALEIRELRRAAREAALLRVGGRRIVAESAVFRRLIADAVRVGRRDVPVLLRGETGTGKELVAALLHASGPRRDRPFVRFNCAALPDNLAEAELFGHEKGAFTGATHARRGFFREAEGGTLVLDEVGELSLPVQAKLLRALSDGEIQPVGAGKVARVDVRVVASTNRDLAAEARAGRFREDLYYRLAVVELVLPPLRERREDIPALAEELCARYAARFGLDDARLSPALLTALAARDYPGNVRELENTIGRLLALSDGGELGVEALRERPAGTSDGAPAGLREAVASFERELLARTMSETGGNQSEAARRLRVTRVTLLDKLKRHGLR